MLLISSQLTNHSLAAPGDITAAELGEVMRGLGLNPSDSELHDLIAEADVNKDGSIDFNGIYAPPPHNSILPTGRLNSCLEFLNMMARTVKEVDNEEELKNAFKVFDKDGSGTISTEELRNVLRSLGENLTDAELDEMIQLADRNGDGHIDCKFWARPPGRPLTG